LPTPPSGRVKPGRGEAEFGLAADAAVGHITEFAVRSGLLYLCRLGMGKFAAASTRTGGLGRQGRDA
jgi:hypothetical protein